MSVPPHLTQSDLTVGRSDGRSPGILYGTAWKKLQTTALVAKAIDLGFRGIDTACQPKHYDEAAVGAGVAVCIDAGVVTRNDLYLQTKFTPLSGQDPSRIPYDPGAPVADQVAQSFRVSLQNLRTTYLDCLVLHSPLADARQTDDAWQAMETIVDASGSKHIGISNCYSAGYLQTLYRRARVKPAVVQNRFYAQTNYDREIRVFCRQHGITYQSFWTLTANAQILSHDTTVSLASKYARTPAQILFRYLTHVGVVPLTGTTSELHMRQDLQIFDFNLTEREQASFGALL